MSVLQALSLTIGGLIFGFWAWQMFSVLFLMRRRATDETGRSFPGVGDSLRQWHVFLTSPQDRGARRRLGATTLGMFAWTLLSRLLAT